MSWWWGRNQSYRSIAVNAMLGPKDLAAYFLGADLVEALKRPVGGIRYLFGEVGDVPNAFVAKSRRYIYLKPVDSSLPPIRNWGAAGTLHKFLLTRALYTRRLAMRRGICYPTTGEGNGSDPDRRGSRTRDVFD